MKTAIGKVLRELRLHFGYKQEYIAYKLKITVNTYASIENGRTEISSQKLYEVSKIFTLPAQHIFALAVEVFESEEDYWLPNAIKRIIHPKEII